MIKTKAIIFYANLKLYKNFSNSTEDVYNLHVLINEANAVCLFISMSTKL